MNAVETIPGQGNNKPPRYFLSTRLTHRMLVQNIKRTITDTERDAMIATLAESLASSGPFRDLKFVHADATRSATEVLVSAGIDSAHVNRIVVLDPSQFSLRNGMEKATLLALTAAMGLDHTPVQWASSAVFAVVNTQRRAVMRGFATEYIARQKALAAPEVQLDEELKAVGTKELATAREQLIKNLRRAYQHIVFLGQPDPDAERSLEQITFDADNLTALDGTMVWKALVEADKALDAGQFSARALIHNLRDRDYGRSLADIRSAFYSAPRLPLLFGGDDDLQRAIFDAAAQDLVRIIDGNDNPVAVTNPNQVNLTSAGLRLAKPAATQDVPEDDNDDQSHNSRSDEDSQDRREGGTSAQLSTPPKPTDQNGTEPPAEKRVVVSFTRNLLNQDEAADQFAALFRHLYLAADEGREERTGDRFGLGRECERLG